MVDAPHQHPEQDIQKGKFVLNGAEFSVDAGAPLPDVYGDNRLVLMVRDPFWFFAYWEITHDRAEQIRVAHGRDIWDRTAMVLRVYDLGDSSQTPIDAASFFDVEVTKFSRQWYVQVPESNRVYVADLGLRSSDGKFISLFRSNVIRQPSGRVSDQLDSQWMSVGVSVDFVTEQKSWEEMARIAISAGSSKGQSGGNAGAESGTLMSLRWEFLRAVFSGSVPSSWKPKEPQR